MCCQENGNNIMLPIASTNIYHNSVWRDNMEYKNVKEAIIDVLILSIMFILSKISETGRGII
jgi:hypothetical protein